MPDYDPVQKISIIPRGNAGGLTFFTPSEERMESGLYSRAYLQNQMAVALGGRVAEEIVYGEDEVTTGASNDLQQVASTARQMITRFGMSDKLGPVALGRSQGGMFLGRDIAAERDFSEDTASTIDQEVSDLVDVAYKRATKVLVDNRTVLDELAELLVEQETVDAEELQELSDHPRRPRCRVRLISPWIRTLAITAGCPDRLSPAAAAAGCGASG